MRICDMWGVLLQERVILAGPIFHFHVQLLEHAYGGLKYEIQSKAFSGTSSENSSTGSGILVYTCTHGNGNCHCEKYSYSLLENL